MAAHGDGDKPIWMTELGWNTSTTGPGSCTVGMWKGQKPLGVSEAQQAEFLTQAFGASADPGSRSRSGSACRTSRVGTRRRLRPLPPRRLGEARRIRLRGARPWDPARPCGGVIDTSGPDIQIAKPTDGAKFVDVLPIDARRSTCRRRRHPPDRDLGRRQVRVLRSATATRRCAASGRWRSGSAAEHTLTFKAEDEAGNKSSRRSPSTRSRKLPKVKTSASLGLEQLDPFTVRVTGGVSMAKKARAAAKLRGKAFVVFQKRGGGKRKCGRRRSTASVAAREGSRRDAAARAGQLARVPRTTSRARASRSRARSRSRSRSPHPSRAAAGRRAST